MAPGIWNRARAELLAGAVVALVLLVAWSFNLFSQFRLQLTNVYYIPTDVSDRIIIVALDDASLNRYGRSPSQWPRSIYAALISVLEEAQARVVAFDLLFSEAGAGDSTLRARIEETRQSENRTRVVIAAAGVQPASPSTLEHYPQAIRYENVLLPIDSLTESVDYLGYVNTFPDVDGLVRRQPTIIEIDGQPQVSWSLAVYLAYLRIPAAALPQLVTEETPGQVQITPARTVYIDDLGFWLQNYAGPPYRLQNQTFPVVSLVDVVNSGVDPAVFEDKIVLVGLINSAGLTDQYAVPSAPQGQLMSGVEIQANAVETLLQGVLLHEQPRTAQAITILLLSLVASAVYGLLRWYFKLVAAVVLLGLWVVFCFMNFALAHEITNLFDTSLALVLPVLVSIGVDINREIRRRLQSEFLLESVVQVSQQQMVIQNILPYVAQDVGRIVPQAQITFWQWHGEDQPLTAVFHSGGGATQSEVAFSQLVHEVAHGRSHLIRGQLGAFPVTWRNRLVGVLAIGLPRNHKFTRRTIGVLQRLGNQLAPSLENAFLYTDLKRQYAIQEAILGGSPAGIMVVDQQCQIVHLNQVFVEVLSTPASQLINKQASEVFVLLGLSEDTCQTLQQVIDHGQPFRQEITIGDLSYTLAASDIAPFQRWVIILTDITQVVELSQLKTYIIRMLSHDLGNPLSRILGYGRILHDDAAVLSETHRVFVDNILSDGEHMDRIITDVLNLEQMRSTKQERENLDFRQLVAGVCDHFALEMKQKQLVFLIDLDNHLGCVSGNRRELTQAVENLVSNAVKYTPEQGQITVSLALYGENTMRLTVADSGYGIPAAAHEKLFTPFFRVKNQHTLDIRGTGLGLNLVKLVVEKHDGHVWFESEEGHGSKFFVELPLLPETAM